MAVPSSGQLRLRADIANEVDGSDTGTNVSLGTLSNTAGFAEPDKMSDFYGYTSVVAPTCSVDSESVTSTGLTVRGTLTNNGGESIGTGSMKIYFGTNSTVTSNTQYSVSHSTGSSGASGSTYTYAATGLTAETTYYFAYKATNSAGTTTSSTGSRTTPLPANPLTASKRQCTGGGNNDCTTLVSTAYGSSTTIYFDGIYDVSGSYQSTSSTMRVYASSGGVTSRSDHNNSSINGSGSWYGAGQYGYGPCYCGWSTVSWSFTRSSYASQGGEWCKVGHQTTIPAFLYDTC